jgi:hypothetical protein
MAGTILIFEDDAEKAKAYVHQLIGMGYGNTSANMIRMICGVLDGKTWDELKSENLSEPFLPAIV